MGENLELNTVRAEELSGLEKFVKIYNLIMSSIALVFLLGFLISVLIQIFCRTFLPKTPSWTEEAARYLFIYMVAFGSSVAVHTKEFVGVDLLISYFPRIINKIIEILTYVGMIVFSSILMKKSVLRFSLIKYRMVSTAMQINMKYIYVSMIVLFGFLIFSYLLEILLVFVKKGEVRK
ncbi:MAG: TRAP transporter small permease [Fusobacteriaceae bacterium]|jgi:TRAP-type C4-dicarboxylate transport system permease small subunit|nr:TRAP transporter small permease [Fusobacteriaceae bacterium]